MPRLLHRSQRLESGGAMHFSLLLIFLADAAFFSTALAAPLRLEPADSPVDNPMKGLVPYAGNSQTCWLI